MQIHNSFDVPLPPAKAWAVLIDVPRIAPCMPGAVLTRVVDDKTYQGTVSLRLGPVALSFNGVAVFEEIDRSGQTARVKAQGTDSKGRGGAGATVTFRLEPIVDGTRVLVDTDLNLSGSVAQYGRASGVIQQVAAELIKKFAMSLKAEIERSAPAPDAAGPTSTRQPQNEPPRLHVDAPPKSISGLSLMLRVVWNMIVGVFRRQPPQ